MANRQFNKSMETQGVRHTYLPIKVLPNGTGTPTIGEGDPNQSYVTISRTGAGAFTIKTNDPYVALVSWQATVSAASQANWTVSRGTATQNADFTWSIPFTIYDAGTATDLAAASGNSVDLLLIMRNTNVVP